MSDNTSRPDPKPGGKKPFDKLKEALAAHTDRGEGALLDDSSSCVSLVRLRDIALEPGLTTAVEVSHLKNCRRCTVMLRAMQSELGTGMQNLPARIWSTPAAENIANILFGRLHGQVEEPERARMLMWHAHDPARALRHHHHTGPHSDAIAFARLLGTTLHAAVADPLTPWAQSYDSSWPLMATMVELAAEATRLDVPCADVVAEAYAGAARDAPIPLKAVLIYGLGALSGRGSQFHRAAENIASRIADGDRAEGRIILGMLVQTDSLCVPYRDRWDDVLEESRHSVVPFLSDADERLRELDVELRNASPAVIASTLQDSVMDAVEQLFQSHDSLTGVLRLLGVRYFVHRTLEQARRQHAEAAFRDIIHVIVHSAQRRHGRLFLAIELALQAGHAAPVVQAMTDLLEDEDPRLRLALFVYFVESVARHNEAGVVSRFAGNGSDWTFVGGALHPFKVFGERAARLARHDSMLAALLDWSNDRLDLEGEEMLEETTRA